MLTVRWVKFFLGGTQNFFHDSCIISLYSLPRTSFLFEILSKASNVHLKIWPDPADCWHPLGQTQRMLNFLLKSYFYSLFLDPLELIFEKNGGQKSRVRVPLSPTYQWTQQVQKGVHKYGKSKRTHINSIKYKNMDIFNSERRSFYWQTIFAIATNCYVNASSKKIMFSTVSLMY